ncbi:MAG: hypothetical protein AAF703_09890 [Cyanobacteria bacterium P01_D01_bin.105]
MKKFWIVCAVLLVIGLNSCSALAEVPPEAAVQQAVTQQLTNAQTVIAEELELPAPAQPNFKVEHLSISRREKLTERVFETEGYPSNIYKVSGTVETTLTTATGKTQQVAPFEVILGITPPVESPVTAPAIETWYLIPSPEASAR